MTLHDPSALPNGWFRVAFAADLVPGTLMPLAFFGRELVLVTAASGTPAVFEAHCPHLGAHFGHGGTVVGETLRCPFHAWRFDLEGRCVEVPYAKRIPSRARARTLPIRVRSGIVFVWHDASDREPTWEPPDVPEVANPAWTSFTHRRWTIRTRNQEIAENTVDPAHFKSVHGYVDVPEPVVRFGEDQFSSESTLVVEHPKGAISSRLEVRWFGLGIGLTRMSGTLEQLFVSTLTPIDAQSLDVCFSFMFDASKGLSPDSGFGRASIAESVRQLNQDIPIWEHKAFLARPLLCDGDGPIPEFRRWAARFYSDAHDRSPRE